MLKEKATTLLKIRPGETRMVLFVAGLFLCIQAGQGIGENAAFTLFLARLDVTLLPYMYMGLGGVVFVASLVYATSLGRFRNANVVVYLLTGAAVLFLIEWLGIVLFQIPLYPLLWLTTFGMSVLLGTLLWTVAADVCDARQAKRLFPLFTSMGILGSVLGNSLTGAFASLLGTDTLILLYAALLGTALLLAREIVRSFFRAEPPVPRKFELMRDVRSGYDFVRGSQLFRLVALCSILYSVLFFTVDFPFSEIVSTQYAGDEAGLAGFRGLFTSVTTAVTFAVSLLLANRVYTRLGIVNSVLIMPLTYVVAFVIFFISFDFWGAVGARFSQLVVLGGLAGTAWSALFNVVPPERRGQVLAFNNGVPAQIGVVLSGLLIILGNSVLANSKVVLLLGAGVAVVTVYLTLKMRAAYGDALLSALRAGRVEVFSEEEESFSGYQQDPAALQTVLQALHDPKPNIPRLAADMLARMDAVLSIPDLLQTLTDEDAGVRAAAIRALTDLDVKPALDQVIRRLEDPDASVREQALTSLPRLGLRSSPDLVALLEGLLRDEDVAVRLHAAVVLIALQEGARAQPLLSEYLHSPDPARRRTALDAYGHVASNLAPGEPIPFDVGPILDALDDPAPIVRREAVEAAAMIGDESLLDRLSRCLLDEDATVRRIAAGRLKAAWPESRPAVMPHLQGSASRTVDAALDAIPVGDEAVLDELLDFARREVEEIQRLQKLADLLIQPGRVVALLRETLISRRALGEERLIKAVGIFGNPRALDLIRKSLNAGDPATRASALEALETLGDRRITQLILPILDSPVVAPGSEPRPEAAAEVIQGLLSEEDHWLRGLAAGTSFELGLMQLAPALQELSSDPIPFVKDAATNALARLDGDDRMKTLKTLTTLERILLMREVPMFAGLSPEDLEQVAEIAQEQVHPPGALICREGEHGSTLFIIVSGAVEVIKTMGDTDSTIAVRGPGDFLGEMAILESVPRSATLRAQEEVRVLEIDGDAFKAILRDRPEVAISVLRHMSTRVRQLSEQAGMAAAGG